MRKIVIGLVLAVMAVFSLSAFETLKERHVDNAYEGRADVILGSRTRTDGVSYRVIWKHLNGSDVLDYYDFSSLEQAFNVWNMNWFEICDARQLYHEDAVEVNGTLYLIKYYEIK